MQAHTADCVELPVLAELVSLAPRVIAAIAPRRWRDELEQMVLCDCWRAIRNGAAIRSPLDYARTAAQRAFARIRQPRDADWLSFDSSLLDEVPVPEEPAANTRPSIWDVASLRAQLKSVLDDRHRAVYVHHYERGLRVRATARACACDPKQVRRCLAHIHARLLDHAGEGTAAAEGA